MEKVLDELYFLWANEYNKNSSYTEAYNKAEEQVYEKIINPIWESENRDVEDMINELCAQSERHGFIAGFKFAMNINDTCRKKAVEI